MLSIMYSAKSMLQSASIGKGSRSWNWRLKQEI